MNNRKFIYVLLTIVGIVIISLLFYFSPELTRKSLDITHDFKELNINQIQPLKNGVYAVEGDSLMYYSAESSKIQTETSPKTLAEGIMIDQNRNIFKLKKKMNQTPDTKIDFDPEAVIKLQDYFLINNKHMLVLDERLNKKYEYEFDTGIAGVFSNSNNTINGVITMGTVGGGLSSSVILLDTNREINFKLTLKDEYILGAHFIGDEELAIATSAYLYVFKEGVMEDKNPMPNTMGFSASKKYIVRTSKSSILIQNTQLENLYAGSVEEDIIGVVANDKHVVAYGRLTYYLYDGEELKTYRPNGNIKGIRKDGNRIFIIYDNGVIEID